jgi:nicotinamide-nucleotide amidase
MNERVQQLSRMLLAKRLSLVTAESCTGGMLSMWVTSISGSSQIFDRGFVTYSDKAKHELLSVPLDILKYYGAVSPECAESMVDGALNHSSADIAVSITGIAGPDGGSSAKPVGLVYIAVCERRSKTICVRNLFTGDRTAVREQACLKALDSLIEVLSKD